MAIETGCVRVLRGRMGGGCIGKRDMKAKKGADLEVAEEESSDDGRQCHTASITFDGTKVKAKIERVGNICCCCYSETLPLAPAKC